jgi:hypothetical protein
MTMADEATAQAFQQVVDYARHQSAKGIGSLASLMERTGADWQRELEGMNEAQMDYAPGSEWSARQVVTHFVNVTAGINRQIADLTGGRLAALEVDEAKIEESSREAPPATVAEAQNRLDALFGEIVTQTRSLEGNEHLQKQFPHPMFGQLNITEWIAFQRVHSVDHMRQIDKNKADAGYPSA